MHICAMLLTPYDPRIEKPLQSVAYIRSLQKVGLVKGVFQGNYERPRPFLKSHLSKSVGVQTPCLPLYVTDVVTYATDTLG